MSMGSPPQYDLSGVNGAAVFRDLPEGLKMELKDGATGEIVANPHDGSYLLLKIVESPDDPSRVEAEEWVYFQDVKGVAS